ncbi:hypothetical protein AUEXF2481DRAFT_35528 [Aureobasidium subglaciale EXF-2481]|uniref:Uncharacterized protein n=1 Tax=Aureobasidium subglaciale (strain EXF-2481) TaxID=1043005 RepID=A0A074YZS0_AURSE|nr:uncharacterized protein AUEXF2481DRAFT_35528 [Aureobasidium subglaciale EXF-2481]KEQ99617.1 hypothetical protein AUEXF2481DRAFT_35528 [Aureobasidium subglaciale EXF-2481]
MSIARKLVNAVVSIGGFAVGVGVYHRFADAVPTTTTQTAHKQEPRPNNLETPRDAGVGGVGGKQTS